VMQEVGVEAACRAGEISDPIVLIGGHRQALERYSVALEITER
jgi:hypothetical protein